MNAMTREWKIGDVVAPANIPVGRPADEKVSWFVLQVFGGAEQSVERRIARLARRWRVRIDVYCPMQKVELPATCRRGRRFPARTIIRPAFSGYLFVGLRDSRLMLDLDQVGGAIDFIRQLGAPVALRQSVVDAVRTIEGDGGLNSAMPVVMINVGDRVLVTGGPFASFPARVISAKDVPIRADLTEGTEVTLGVNIFGRETIVKLPLSDIESA